jgi:hypothetical protein
MGMSLTSTDQQRGRSLALVPVQLDILPKAVPKVHKPHDTRVSSRTARGLYQTDVCPFARLEVQYTDVSLRVVWLDVLAAHSEQRV